jgi:hypothetical protein
MPRPNPKLIVAAMRSAEARRAVDNQRGLIAQLKALGESTSDAEHTLQTYIRMLEHLDAHEQKLREQRRAKKPRRRTLEDKNRARSGSL